MMMDMSKAFDTVDRKTLIRNLKDVINPDELYITASLLQDVKLSVRIEGRAGKSFETTIGEPQTA
jgi:hypothetical protein